MSKVIYQKKGSIAMAEFSPPPLKQINFSLISFIKSASRLDHSPEDKGIEVAFVGRSNAGKSSAINAITGRNGLARTSKTPGRTQLMNFFQLDEQRRLVDLPGYGYAKVPEKIHRQIEILLNEYLSSRRSLQGLILLMDIRNPLTKTDQQLIDYSQQYQLPVHILLTKCDKLKRGQSQNSLLQTRKLLDPYPNCSVQTFSAQSMIGVEEAQQKIGDWFNFESLVGISERKY
jgi:GTP-binding protein